MFFASWSFLSLFWRATRPPSAMFFATWSFLSLFWRATRPPSAIFHRLSNSFLCLVNWNRPPSAISHCFFKFFFSDSSFCKIWFFLALAVFELVNSLWSLSIFPSVFDSFAFRSFSSLVRRLNFSSRSWVTLFDLAL